MRTLATLVSIIALTAPAFAKDMSDVREQERELRESERMVQEDNANIANQNENIRVNRAEKARAKRDGDYARQASESAQIGANKTARSAHKGKRYVDRKMVEEDREDLREARDEYNDRRYDREMSPSAGSRRYGDHASYQDRFPNPYPTQGIVNRPSDQFAHEVALERHTVMNERDQKSNY